MAAFGQGPAIALRQRAAVAGFDFTGPALPPGASLNRASSGQWTDATGRRSTAATDAPRFDCDPTTGMPRGLLVEPGATNLVTAATLIAGGTGWSYGANLGGSWTVTVSADVGTMAGPGSATRFVATGGGEKQLVARKTVNLSGSKTVSVDVYVPAQSGVTSWTLYADVGDTETATAAPSTVFGRWTRVAASASLAAARGFVDLNILFNGNSLPAAGQTIFVACLQVEDGTAATSFIPTDAATASRAPDVLTLDWASRGVADGPMVVRYAFDDSSSQDIATTVSGGQAIVPTTLARRCLRRATRA